MDPFIGIFPTRLGSEKEAMDLAEVYLDQWDLGQDRLEDIRTIISEACLNAMEHGNGLDESLTYEVEFSVQQDCFCIRICDSGRKANWKWSSECIDITTAIERGGDSRGWGLKLITALADSWKFEIKPEHTCLEIMVRINNEKGT